MYQIFLPEMVYYACGHGWVRILDLPKPLLDFLAQRTIRFDCSLLPAPVDPLPPGFFFQAHYYLAKLVGLTWRLSSIDYTALWPVAAAFSGAYLAGSYALFRLFFARPLSVLGSLVLAVSPIAIGVIYNFRDYSKAPFFLWALVLIFAAARSASVAKAIALASAAGVVVGIGYGFRTDMAIMIPIGLIPMLLIRPKIGWPGRLTAIVAFGAATYVAAYPVPSNEKNAGGFGTLLMQGLTEPYQTYLALGPAPYSFGSKYSDELTLSSIASDLSAEDPNWDRNEPQVGQGLSQAATRSGPYVLRWLPLFAGDMATQSIKSALWVLGMPALVSADRRKVSWKMPVVFPSLFGTYSFEFYDALATEWLPWIALAGLCLFFVQNSGVRPGETLALTAMFAALLGYTAIQFAPRHIFHLEFIWILCALAILRAPFWIAQMRRGAPTFIPLVAVIALLVVGVRFALVSYQDTMLAGEVQRLLEMPRQQVASQRENSSETTTLIRIPVPQTYSALVTGPADSMDSTMGQRGPQWNVRAATDRLLLSIGGPSCVTGPIKLIARYARSSNAWQGLDFSIDVDASAAATTHVLLPAIYRTTQHFDGIEVQSQVADCIAKVERIEGKTKLPAVLSMVIPDNGRNVTWHRDLGGFPTSPIARRATFEVLGNTAEKLQF